MRRKISTLLSVLLLSCSFTISTVLAQSPQKLSYQAVIRNASSELITNTQVSIQISILHNAEDGPPVYVETQSPTSNENGLVTFEIGTGITSDSFSDIDWSSGPYFIKTETDPTGGINYSIVGVSQLLSVPYALHAKTAENATNVTISGDEAAFNVWDKNAADDFDGNYNNLSNTPDIPVSVSELNNDTGYLVSADDADADPANELQVISISNDTIFLSKGSSVILPENFSGDFNELTNIPENLDTDASDDFDGNYNNLSNTPAIPVNVSELNNDEGYLVSADDADADPANELQVISISNDTIFLSKGSSVVLPENFSGDFNELTNVPENLDTDASDDFDGNYNNLTNKPYLSGDVLGETDSTIVQKVQGKLVIDAMPEEGQILKWDTTFNAWFPKNDALGAAGSVDGVVSSIAFTGSDAKTLTMLRSNGLGNLSASFDDLVDDADADPNNEIQSIYLSEDTIFLSDGDYVVLPETFDGQYTNLTGKPSQLSNFSNDVGYIKDGNINWDNSYGLITNPDDADADPTNELQTISIIADTIYLDNGGSVILPPNFSGSYNDLTNIPMNIDTDATDDFDGNYNNLSNKPNLGIYLTSENDADPANEIQILSFSNDTIYLTNGGYVELPTRFSGDFNDLTFVPVNLDTDKTDDFDGNYYNLTNRPLIPENVSELYNDLAYLSIDDLSDNDSINEIQTISLSNDTIYLSNGGFIKIPDGFSGDFNDLTNIPTLQGDISGELSSTKVEKIQGMNVSNNIPADGQVLKWDDSNSKWIPQDDMLGADGTTDGVVTSVGVSEIATTKTLTLTRSVGNDLTAIFTDEINDADADPTNEIEVADQSGNTGKFLTTNGTDTYWDNVSAPGDNLGNHELNQNLQLNNFKLTNTGSNGLELKNNGQATIDADEFEILTLKRRETGGAALQFINSYDKTGAIGLGSNGGVFIKTPGVQNGTALFVDSLGKMGLGTMNPKEKLHIVGGSAIISGGDTSKLYLANRTDRGFKTTFISKKINTWGGANLYFSLNQEGNYNNAGIEDAKMTILNNGNIGIGTISPNELLDVNGKIKSKHLQITNGAVSNYILTTDESGNATWTDPLTIVTNDSDPNNEIELPDQAGNTGKYLSTDGVHPVWENISTTGSSGMGDHTATENIKMNNHWLSNNGNNLGIFIDTLGNVGIGTDSPKSNLSVNGKMQVNNWVISTPFSDRMVVRPSGNENSVFTIMTALNSNKSELDFADSDDYNPGRITYQHTTGNTNDLMSFWVNDSEKLRINSNGYVGIGENDPKGKLHVNGDKFILSSSDNAYLYLANTSDNQFKTAIISEKTGSNGKANLHFALNDDDNNDNASIDDAKLSILTNGNVGIGENNPTERLAVKANTPNHVMSIENTDDETGDGLSIKLNRTHPAWNGLSYITMNDPIQPIIEAQREIIEQVITGEIDQVTPDILFNIANSVFGESLLDDATVYLYNNVAEIINDELNLPISYNFDIKVKKGKIVKDLKVPNGINLTWAYSLKYKTLSYPTSDISLFDRTITLVPEFPTLDFTGRPFEMPKFEKTLFQNTLSTENEFVTFYDGEDRWCGAIAGESLEDWFFSFLEVNNLIQFVSNVATLDPAEDILSAVAFASDHIASYNSLGVSYQSGHGDYAEWLERLDPEENISAGDIVGVIGGKITKNLTHAEQIMAVSDKPIIIGNTPNKEKLHLGNNVAFMGQIPVKIMGPVKTGDYIIANPEIEGYGIAINSKDMTVENFTKTVGRAWEENLNEGAKLVNTVVGIHNGDWVKVFNKQQEEIKNTNKRLDLIEKQLEKLMN